MSNCPGNPGNWLFDATYSERNDCAVETIASIGIRIEIKAVRDRTVSSVASIPFVAKLVVMVPRFNSFLLLLAVAVSLTFLFWWPLYFGAGFIGGDLYPYFFPQKAFYADCLKHGLFPLWNDLSGFGYPILGESQTGAAYPFHFVLYYCFDLNTAYNLEHLLHYVICFVAMFLFARRLGIADVGSYFAALVFTYGWFPPRSCLEWAILTGAWMPVALWCVESFLQTGWWRYAIGLSVALGLQLLAGHFHLAFITQLLVVTYAAFRLLSHREPKSQEQYVASPCRRSIATGLILAFVAGLGLAAVQLLPTWELKQRSTRVITGGEYDPAYGHMPPLYVSQAVMPWRWYNLLEVDEDNLIRDAAEFLAPWHWFGPRRDYENNNLPYDLDRAIRQSRLGALSTGTNKVEAHFYCGIVPVTLAIGFVIGQMRRRFARVKSIEQRSLLQRSTTYWLIAGFFGLLYATGLLLPIGRHLPGFSFFRGPGRYGIIASLAVALFAGQMLSLLAQRLSIRTARGVLILLAFGSTCGDLWLVGRMVKYAFVVNPPRISLRDQSEVGRLLKAETRTPRLLAPGPNVCNLLGVSCVPWYLGMAPAEYVDPQFAMPEIPKPSEPNKPVVATTELIEWLSRSGVTHVLNFEPLDLASWKAQLIWTGVDPFLNRVWGRNEPIYLYRFHENPADETASFPGRAYSNDKQVRVLDHDWAQSKADERRVTWESDHAESTTLILTELAFPGWTVQQNASTLRETKTGMFRAVEVSGQSGQIEWKYKPQSVFVGAIVTLITVFLLAAVAHVRFWHPALVARVLNSVCASKKS